MPKNDITFGLVPHSASLAIGWQTIRWTHGQSSVFILRKGNAVAEPCVRGQKGFRMTSALDHFKGKFVLVVEDEFLIAETTCMDLERAGAVVVGPVPTVARALSLLQSRQVDAALLDIKLNEETSISIVNELQRRAIPYVFVSNISPDELPPRFRDYLVGKPADMKAIATNLFLER